MTELDLDGNMDNESEESMLRRQLDMANKIHNDRVSEIIKLNKEKADLSSRLTQWTKEIDMLANIVHRQDNEISALKETLKDALQCDKYNDHTSGIWQIEAKKLIKRKANL